jgi:hypothetical protein
VSRQREQQIYAHGIIPGSYGRDLGRRDQQSLLLSRSVPGRSDDELLAMGDREFDYSSRNLVRTEVENDVGLLNPGGEVAFPPSENAIAAS